MGRGFLDHDVVVGEPTASTAVVLGDVHAEEAGLGQGVPQLGRFVVARDDVLEVLAAELAHEAGHSCSQFWVMIGGID